MITKSDLVKLIEDSDLLCKDADFLVDLIMSKLSWQSMDNAPKDRPILVWAYLSAEWWKRNNRERKHMLVEWDNVNDDWLATAGAMGEQDGSALCAEEPIAWMEIFKYDAS